MRPCHTTNSKDDAQIFRTIAPRLFHLKMVYFVVVNNVEEINNEINRKHENAQVI